MKKISIILVSLIIFTTIISAFVPMVYADGYDFSGKINEINGKTDDSAAATSTQNVVGAILQVARIIAVGVALIMLVVLAIKYMSSAPNEKAEIKKYAVVYVVGAVVLFAASGILAIIQKFAETNIQASSGT